MQYIAGISISIFFAALILSKSEKSHADKILIVWMLFNATHLGLQYPFLTESMHKYPSLYGFLAPMPLLHGVFLFLYVASVTDQFPKKKWLVAIHFIPPVIFFIYLCFVYFPLSAAEQIHILENEGAEHRLYIMALLGSIFISGIAYVIWSSVLLKRHRKKILNHFSHVDNVNLKWLQFLIVGLGLLWLVVIFSRNDSIIFSGVQQTKN